MAEMMKVPQGMRDRRGDMKRANEELSRRPVAVVSEAISLSTSEENTGDVQKDQEVVTEWE